MNRLSYLLLQGFLLFTIHEEMPLLNKGVVHQVEARITGKFTCQDDVMHLDCRPSKVLRIVFADYSRKQSSVCSRGNSAEYCDPAIKTSLIQEFCEGKTKCKVAVNKRIMGDKCPTVFKYLNVMYSCETPPTPTKPLYFVNKSTMVLTRPSTTPTLNNYSTGHSFHSIGNPTKIATKMVFYSTSAPKKENEEESTSAVYGFVLYNGENVNTTSGFLITLILGLVIFL